MAGERRVSGEYADSLFRVGHRWLTLRLLRSLLFARPPAAPMQQASLRYTSSQPVGRHVIERHCGSSLVCKRSITNDLTIGLVWRSHPKFARQKGKLSIRTTLNVSIARRVVAQPFVLFSSLFSVCFLLIGISITIMRLHFNNLSTNHRPCFACHSTPTRLKQKVESG